MVTLMRCRDARWRQNSVKAGPKAHASPGRAEDLPLPGGGAGPTSLRGSGMGQPRWAASGPGARKPCSDRQGTQAPAAGPSTPQRRRKTCSIGAPHNALWAPITAACIGAFGTCSPALKVWGWKPLVALRSGVMTYSYPRVSPGKRSPRHRSTASRGFIDGRPGNSGRVVRQIRQGATRRLCFNTTHPDPPCCRPTRVVSRCRGRTVPG
jgi:hypothetical protein